MLQVQSLEKSLWPKKGNGPFNIALFGGSADDNNALFFYNGAMSVLQPFINKGKQLGKNKVSTLRWDGAVAQARMDNLLSAYYGKGEARVDEVLSPFDGQTSTFCPSSKA